MGVKILSILSIDVNFHPFVVSLSNHLKADCWHLNAND